MKFVRKMIAGVHEKSGLDRLDPREKLILLLGIAFVFCFMVLQAAILPYLDAKEQLERSLQRKQNDVLEMALLQKQYRELKQRQGQIAEKIEQRNPQFSLFGFLEQQSDAARVKNRVAYMKPSTAELDDGFRESTVEMKLEEVTLAQLVNFLVKVESVDNVVVVKRIAIQKNKKEEDLLDVVFNIVTFEKQPS